MRNIVCNKLLFRPDQVNEWKNVFMSSMQLVGAALARRSKRKSEIWSSVCFNNFSSYGSFPRATSYEVFSFCCLSGFFVCLNDLFTISSWQHFPRMVDIDPWTLHWPISYQKEVLFALLNHQGNHEKDRETR